MTRSEDRKQRIVFEIPDTRVERYQENGGLSTSPQSWGIDVGLRSMLDRTRHYHLDFVSK